jgi:trimeric autotransporter adhesin
MQLTYNKLSMNFRKILSFTFLLLAANAMHAELYSTSYDGKSLTQYTNGSINDTIYFVCGDGTGTLTAFPEGGVPGYNFIWTVFNPLTNTWGPYSLDSNPVSSTISGLTGGAYRVTVIDANNNNVGCFKAWISQVTTSPNVDVADIPNGCTAVSLQGTINYGTATPYYNLPPDGMLIGPDTQISVCFSGTTGTVGAINFKLVSPAACGSQVVQLLPFVDANLCNSNNDFTNVCFTTAPAANLDMCATLPNPLTGTFSSFGPLNTPINWSTIIGCDGTLPGWNVVATECAYDGFPTFVTYATVTFTGQTACGLPQTVTYTTPVGYSGYVEDGICANTGFSTGSGGGGAVPIPYTNGFVWTANPGITIPNATSSLNPVVNPGPVVDTQFTLTITGNGPGNACGTGSDTELFHYAPTIIPDVTPISPICINSGPVNLSVDIAGGTWDGDGVNATTGVFTPTDLGSFIVSYTITQPCVASDQITVVVQSAPDATIIDVADVCESTAAFNLTAATPGGTWTGTGITNSTNGTFDPATSGQGQFTITYEIEGSCSSSDVTIVNVVDQLTVDIVNPGTFCINDAPFDVAPFLPDGTWSGTGITNATNGTFSPATAGAGQHVINYVSDDLCPNSGTVTITVYALPNVNAGSQVQLCVGESEQLNATGAQSYVWTPDQFINNNDIANPVVNPTGTTTYTVTGTDANGCTATDDVLVTVNPLGNVIVNGPFTICAGEEVQLQASGLSVYSWSPSNGLSATNIANPLANPSDTTIYTVTGSTSAGCPGSASLTVYSTYVNALFVPNPTDGYSPLLVVFDNQSTGTEFNWSYGNGDTETTTPVNPDGSTVYEDDGIYTATLVAEQNGCTDTYSLQIEAYSGSVIDTLPNIITPNGDDFNEEFRVAVSFMKEFEVIIFNRWGHEVGRITTPDGTWKPEDNVSGVYFYILNATGVDRKKFVREGSFTLVK